MKGKVLTFDENRGWGKVRLEDGRVVKVTYKNIKENGFIILFEGEKVEVEFDEKKRVKKVRRVRRDDQI